MAISFVGQAFARATTVDLPAGFQAYDVAVVQAFAALTGQTPALPAGWTNIDTATISNIVQRVGYKVLNGAETNIGTWTNATDVQVLVYRGVDWTTPIGNWGERATSAVFRFPSISLTYTDGSSWVVALCGLNDDNLAYLGALATGYVNRSSGNGVGGYVAAWDKGGLTTQPNPESGQIPNGSAGNVTLHIIELLASTDPVPETSYVWEVVAGALPTGIVLDSATGELSAAEGEITAADGTHIFSIRAYNNHFTTQTWTCQLTVYGTGLAPATWSIDMEKLVSLRTLAWHRHTRVISRPVIVEGKHVLYADAANIAYRFDRATVVSSGSYWVSPTLNRTKRQCDYTLVEVLFRYRADDTTIIKVYGSGNGGQTWKDAIMTFVPLFGADQSIRWIRVHFNATGSDVRFKVEFSGTIPVHLYEWQAQLVERESRRKG